MVFNWYFCKYYNSDSNTYCYNIILITRLLTTSFILISESSRTIVEFDYFKEGLKIGFLRHNNRQTEAYF